MIIPAFLALALATAPTDDPFAQLNQSFRGMYKQTRDHLLHETDPVLLVLTTEHMVLLHNGQRHEAQITPRLVTTLKTVAHVPLALYAALLPHADAPLPQSVQELLNDYSNRVRAVQQHLHDGQFNAEQLPRQERILTQAQSLIDEAHRSAAVPRARLESFARAARPLVYGNIHDAARSTIAALHQQMLTWRPLFDQEAWRRLRIVVGTSHMARQHDVNVEYFLHLTHEPFEGRRVVVAEGIWEEQPALDLLGVHILDNYASQSFFGDSQRLHRDVMSDAAIDYLNMIDDID